MEDEEALLNVDAPHIVELYAGIPSVEEVMAAVAPLVDSLPKCEV